jgi:hypothetical protein
MTTLNKAADLFGEEWQGYEVQTFTVRDGKGYYIAHTVDNTREVFTQYEILIRHDDGDETRTYVTTEQELELWTEHLK